MFEEIYEPREDSYLLADQVKKHAFGRVLDIGTGSGIQILYASKNKKVKTILGADISERAVESCKKYFKEKNISFKVSNLFSNVEGKFDTIIFNPPYLPEDVRVKDITIEGGKKGHEITERFIDNVNEYLKENGIILLLFSSLTNKSKVNEIIERNCLESREIAKKRIFFEELYVYLIKKKKILKILDKKRVKDVNKFARGHRGYIYTGNLKGKKIAVKIQREDKAAKNTVNKEVKFLKILNKYKIGPKLLFFGNNYFAYPFIKGVFIEEFLEKANKNDSVNVLKEIFSQCFKMDKLGVNKEEMHNPYKHVIVGQKVILVDFERANKTKKPHNVTQFCQYVSSGKLGHILKKKNIKISKNKIIKSAKEYKKNVNNENFNKITDIL